MVFGLFQKTVGAREIYDSCMDGSAPTISATDVGAAKTSPFSLYCKYHADPARMDPPDQFRQTLADMGSRHESDVLESDYPDIARASYETPQEGFLAALESMAKGAGALSNVPIYYMPEGMHGYPDVLERREGDSAFGRHHYVVREIKVAKHIREHHTMQAAFYALMLGRIQRRQPEIFLITDGDGETREYAYDAYGDALLECIDVARRVRGGWMPPAVYGNGVPPWSNHCNETAILHNDVSLIPGIGPGMRVGFADAGFHTVRDVASSTSGKMQYIGGVGGKTSVRYWSSARAIESGECVRRSGKIDLHERPIEVFLDLEGVGAVFDDASSDYLIGALVRTDGVETYRPFIAEKDGEGAMLESFLELVSGLDDYVIYHWGMYERVRMKAMMERHSMYGEYQMLRRDTMIDLLKVATNAFAFPTYTNSIKDVAKWMGFKWRHDNVSATSAMEMYARYADDPEAGRAGMKLVLDYNEDDCIATRVVKDWLVAKRDSPT